MPRCGMIILAAGASTRMGAAKQLLDFQGQTLLRRAIATAQASVCRPIVVVLGSRAKESQQHLEGSTVTMVINDRWAAGMGTSIVCGLSAIGPVDAVMIYLCDQPLITAASLDQMVAAHFNSSKKITAAFYDQTAGTPVIFHPSLFTELNQLQDQQGGKVLIHRHPQEVVHFPLPEAACDIDTKDDLARLASTPGPDLKV